MTPLQRDVEREIRKARRLSQEALDRATALVAYVRHSLPARQE